MLQVEANRGATDRTAQELASAGHDLKEALTDGEVLFTRDTMNFYVDGGPERIQGMESWPDGAAVLLAQTSCRFPSRFSTSPWPGDTPDSRASARRFAALPAPDPLRCLALLGEPIRQILLPAELHLVRRASSENGARDLLVVLTDVQRDETPHRRRTVEGVQEEPRVLQLSPERCLGAKIEESMESMTYLYLCTKAPCRSTGGSDLQGKSLRARIFASPRGGRARGFLLGKSS